MLLQIQQPLLLQEKKCKTKQSTTTLTKKNQNKLELFFFVKVEKGRCQFQQTFLNFRVKFQNPACLVTIRLSQPPSWIDQLLDFSLSAIPSHKVTGNAIFFNLFIKFVALKSIFIPMYKRTVRPFRDVDVLNVVVSFQRYFTSVT